jgi:hypothetical protein
VPHQGFHIFQTIGSQIAISLIGWLTFATRKIPGTHFCYRLSRPQSSSVAGRIRSIEKSHVLIRNQTHNLPGCSILPQPCYCVASHLHITYENTGDDEETKYGFSLDQS